MFLRVVRYVDDIRLATRAFEAALWHEGISVTCACTHNAVFDPHALWWLCFQRGWDDRFSQLKRRFFCSRCAAAIRQKIRPATIELTRGAATFLLPMPPEAEWKRAVRRVRS